VPKLTQADLAARLQVAGFDIDRAGVSKIECQIREVDDREVLGLAGVLGVRAAWLLGEDDETR
jgi:transcriptional regulator with XRE-family HTH domain